MRSGIYRRQMGRLAFFREWMVGRALRRRRPDFARERPMVSIIGDEVSDAIRSEQIYERDILEFLRDQVLDEECAAGQVALDVGANIGNHSIFLSDLFAKVIAFEPNQLTRSILQINLELNKIGNVEVQAYGLSDRSGSATLQFNPINLGAASLSAFGDGTQNVHTAAITLAVGDDILPSSPPIGFIKIDVEGAEETVLKGLERTLKTHSPLVMIEQWPDVIDYETGASPCFNFLRELGYSAWEIQKAVPFRGPAGKIPTLLLGYTDYRLRAVERLAKREYPALIFTPSSYIFRATNKASPRMRP